MRKKLAAIFFLILLQSAPAALAQQTIFNVPSAEVTPKNKIFLQHESQFRSKDPDQFLNTTNYFAYGVGGDLELDATLFNLSSPASKNVALGTGFKKIFSLQTASIKNLKPKIILGAQLPFSLQSNGVGHWIYSAGSITIPQSQTRLTLGISDGTKQIFGKKVTCAMAGFEQKISEKFSLIADWYSGNHALALTAAGFSYALPRDFTLYAGYQIPNSKKVGRNSFVVEVARIF